MPADFEKCVADGGRVRTKTLGKNEYQRICYKDGKSFAGEVKTKKSFIGKFSKQMRAHKG